MKGNNTEDGEQIKNKTNKWRFSLLPTRRAEPERYGGAGWRRAGGDHLISRRGVTHPSNKMEGGAIISIFLITRWVTHPSNNMEGGAIISIFLITRTIGVSGGTPALWLTAGFQKV